MQRYLNGVSGGSAAGLRGAGQPIEPDPDHAGGGSLRCMCSPQIGSGLTCRIWPPSSCAPPAQTTARPLPDEFGGAELYCKYAARSRRVPSMTTAPEEIAEFVKRSDALLVNLGTLDPARREAAETAARVAVEEQRAWVLDPVFVDRSTFRSDFAKSFWPGLRKPCGSTAWNLKPSQA